MHENSKNSNKKRNMSTNFGYYIFCLVVLIVGFMLVKKVAGCLVKTIIVSILFTVLCAIGWYAKQQGLI